MIYQMTTAKNHVVGPSTPQVVHLKLCVSLNATSKRIKVTT